MHSLIWPAINLGILLGFLIYKTRPGIKKAIQERHESTYAKLNQAVVQAKALANRQKEVEASLRNLDAEKAKIKAEWASRQSVEIEKLSQGQTHLIEQIKNEGKAQVVAIESELKAQVIRETKKAIVTAAQKKLSEKLTPDAQAQIQSTFLKTLGAQ